MNNTCNTSCEPTLDTERCRLARLSRDSRFDGEFFLAVKTTGIYCRPICPARPPAEKNVRYYRHAAQAAQSGYRPCLRCRPESAPNSPAWRGTSTSVQRALDLIAAGALNNDSVGTLAQRLGLGERYLRKLFQAELGVSPVLVAQNQRLLFAKKLLTETNLSMTNVGFAAGFSSVRRFNSAIQQSYACTPSELRNRAGRGETGSKLRLQLQYRPPYDWEGVIDFFRRHSIDALETVSVNCYQRQLLNNGVEGQIQVKPVPGRNALQLELKMADLRQLMPLVALVRRMFDLDANPQVIQAVLAQDPVLQQLMEIYPGIRAPSHPSVFESTVRAIAGQQVSIQAARQLCSRLTLAAVPDNIPPRSSVFFPEPGQLAALDDEYFPMPVRRRETLRAVSARWAAPGSPPDCTELAALKGIGPWTLAIINMRGYSDPDIFPQGDLGLVKAYDALSGGQQLSPEKTEQWRPWRSYAANLLWRSLSQ
jgi:AraC family transcriptional regulator, regulatory protein of adaptative response / DNA-3-methyladenine glycosylase II